MKHTETIENIVKAMQSFAAYEDMPPAEQLFSPTQYDVILTKKIKG